MAQLTPVVTRFNRNFLQMEVVYFAPGLQQATVLRQMGVPVHEIEWSRQRFSPGALSALLKIIRKLEPDIIHAWGHSAQASLYLLKRFMKSMPPLMWTMANDPPIAPKAGFIDRKKMDLVKKALSMQPHVIYPTTAIAAWTSRQGRTYHTHRPIHTHHNNCAISSRCKCKRKYRCISIVEWRNTWFKSQQQWWSSRICRKNSTVPQGAKLVPLLGTQETCRSRQQCRHH